MKNLLLTISVIFLFAASSFAQFGSSGSVDARSMSLAKTYNATTSGIYSIGFNPANMMFGRNDIEFATVLPLPGLAFSAGTNFMSIKDVNYFFGGEDGKAKYLTTEDKQKFDDLFKDGGDVFTGVTVNMLSFMYKEDPVYGAASFAINDIMGGSFSIPHSLVDLGLNGNAFNKVYNFNDVQLQSWWLRNYTLSYARELPEIEQNIFNKIAVGVSFKLVHGYYYVNIEKANSSFVTNPNGNSISASADVITRAAFSQDFGMEYNFDSTTNDAKSNIGLFPKPAGSGFGFDLGVAATMDQWRFSAAITDIGKVTWDKNPVEFTNSGDMIITDLTNQDQRDSLTNKFKSKGRYISSFSTSLPTTLRLGTSYAFSDPNDDIPGSLLVALDINKGFNSVPGNTTKLRVSVGSEWIPMDWLNVRTGLSFGGIDGFNWALGLGFDAGVVEFNIATSDMQSIAAPNTAKRLSFSFGSRWKF